MICASTYLWLCSSRFGQVDDSAAAVSVLIGLKASSAKQECVSHFKELLAYVSQPENPNPEAKFFSLLGFSCCLQMAHQLTGVAVEEIKEQFETTWIDRQGSVSKDLGVDPHTALAWLRLLKGILHLTKSNEPTFSLFKTLVPELAEVENP